MVDKYSLHSSLRVPRFKLWFPAGQTLRLALPHSPLPSPASLLFLGIKSPDKLPACAVELLAVRTQAGIPSLATCVEFWHPCPEYPEKTMVPGELLSLSLLEAKSLSSTSLRCISSPTQVRVAFLNLTILFQNCPQVRQKSTVKSLQVEASML